MPTDSRLVFVWGSSSAFSSGKKEIEEDVLCALQVRLPCAQSIRQDGAPIVCQALV